MATLETKHVEIICDLCKQAINPDRTYVEAQVYGADFHVDCITPHKSVLKALGLDDIKIIEGYQHWGTARKYIYSKEGGTE